MMMIFKGELQGSSFGNASRMLDKNPVTCEGPFGTADRVALLSTAVVAAMYMTKCGTDVQNHLAPHKELELYRCKATGMLFWRPEELAGDEKFYHDLSDSWDSYYKDWRWEYGLLDRYITRRSRVLEVGCGRGFFLRHTEGKVEFAKGLELNNEAIISKVSSWDIIPDDLGSIASKEAGCYDLVCAFQVLEHVKDPAGFVGDCVSCLRPGGHLALSVPNYDHIAFKRREDAFDLPPHHMNHFTQSTFESIADLYHLSIAQLATEPRRFALEPVASATAGRTLYRLAGKVAQFIFQMLYDRYGEPGPTMLIVLRKP